jgi:excisionase family DNA binding protein
MLDLITAEKMNTEAAARLLGLTPPTVRHLVESGSLGCIKLGNRPLYRFTEEHIGDYLRRRESRPLAA